MTPPFVTSRNLATPHGFFGRRGGVSTGAYASLNASLRSNDDAGSVAENRARIRAALGADFMVSVKQVHSADVVIATNEPVSEVEADGLVTTVPGLALGIVTADCGPVLFHDAEAGVVGACHTGWRGALSGIVESTVADMCELGASPAGITAVLGPTIAPESYEVGEAFMAEFTDMDADYARFFHTPPGQSVHFDLPAFILSRLAVMGIEDASWTGQDTYALREDYFSYRRNTHEGLDGYGRNLSAIMLPSPVDSGGADG